MPDQPSNAASPQNSNVGATTSTRPVSIFISYARNDDEPFVHRLYEGLKNATGTNGPLFDVWFDRVSMPSRALTFHQEIRDAIAARERLILVVGPKAIASDYVTQEWQFAYYAANKCVNPIIRLPLIAPEGFTDEQAAKEAERKARDQVPEDLKLLHAEDFRDDTQFDVHLKNLIRQLSESLPPVGKLVAVPELPVGYRAQPERLKALRDLLLIDLQKPVVVTGEAARVGLQGMGGIGKSVLANALAHHPEVKRAFLDNIYWVTFGQHPQIEFLQRQLVSELGGDSQFNDPHTGKERLRQLLIDRAALLILDDVWERDHADAFNVAGVRSRILLTTRDAGLVTALAAKENHYRVELPTLVEAGAILGGAVGVPPDQLPAEASAIIEECGRLPPALALCGGMIQGGISWASVLEALRDHDLKYLSNEHPGEAQHESAWKAMNISLRVLSADEQQRFAELAVFGADTGAPDAAVATLWQHSAGLSVRQTDALLAKLIRRSLVQRLSTTDGQASTRIDLHDLLHHFATGMAKNQFGSIVALNQRLLDAYRAKCPNGWTSGPDDSYFFQNLIRHLHAAGLLDEAVTVLSDLPWIVAKCKAGVVFSLQTDYHETIAALPEAQAELSEQRQRDERLCRWTREITEYSRQWSERRDRMARGETVTEIEPSLPTLVACCRMWSEEEIAAERRRVIENPTRLDQLRAFADFVKSECYPLLEFGRRDGFVVQHAFNVASSGPMHNAADRLLECIQAPLLLRQCNSNAAFEPRPALLLTLEGHSGEVTCVSVTSDGCRAVSGGDDRTVRVWNLENGVCLRILEGHLSWVESVSVTPDGRRAVSGSRDQIVKVWDLEKGACMWTLEGHGGEVTGVGVTPDGRRAISGSRDETIRVWDLDSGVCLKTLKTPGKDVKSVSMTPNGCRAITWSEGGTLRVWDLQSGKCLREIEGQGSWSARVSVSSDGCCAVSSCGETLRVWDLASGVCLRTLQGHGGGIRSVSGTSDGRRAVSVSRDRTLRVWDLSSGASLRTLDRLSKDLTSVSIIADGSRAVTGSADKALRVWDLERGACLRISGGHMDDVLGMLVTPDGRRAISGSQDRTMRVWDFKSRACLHTLKGYNLSIWKMSYSTRIHKQDPRFMDDPDTIFWALNMSVTTDGDRVVSADGTTLRVWDLNTGACLRTLEGHRNWILSVSVTRDGRCAISGGADETLRVWDLETGVCLRTLEHRSRQVWSVSIMPDDRRAISGGADGTLRVWDLDRGECLRTLKGHKEDVVIVSVMPDGRHAVSGSFDKTLRVWDLDSGVSVRTLEGHSARISNQSMTPDGRRVVSGSFDKTLRVWDLNCGTCICTLKGHSDAIRSVSVTADGRWVISGSSDKTLRVWDVTSGALLAVYSAPTPISSAALAHGTNIVSIGTQGGEVVFIQIPRIDRE